MPAAGELPLLNSGPDLIVVVADCQPGKDSVCLHPIVRRMGQHCMLAEPIGEGPVTWLPSGIMSELRAYYYALKFDLCQDGLLITSE